MVNKAAIGGAGRLQRGRQPLFDACQLAPLFLRNNGFVRQLQALSSPCPLQEPRPSSASQQDRN